MLNARAIQLATDAPCYPAKTPAANAKNRRENVYQGAMTVHNSKAKNANLLRTPFQPKSAQPQRLSKDLHLKAPPIQLVVTHQSKPLADKTPFANRVLDDYKTPGPVHQPLKSLNLGTTATLEVPPTTTTNPTPGSARASSTRKHARLPKPQTYHDFQTPANVGNHWDISDGDIVAPEEMDETEKEVEKEPLDFNDEIEYMAPNTLDLEYQPPFDFELPNYKLLGQDILHKFYSYPEVDITPPPPSFEFTFRDDEFMKWDDLSLPSLSPSDDEGKHSGTRTRRSSKQSQVTRISTSATVKKPVGSNRSVSVMNVRSKDTTLASTRPNRPASSISLKPPPNSTTSAAKPKTRTSTTKISMPSASSRMAPKPATTSGTSTKTKLKQPTRASSTTKATTSTNRGAHSISNIPRPSSIINSMRPASAIGVNETIRRATNAATLKRPSTSTSVVRPKPQTLTTSSVQQGMKSSLRTTRASTTVTAASNIKVVKQLSANSSGVKTMMKGRANSISMIKGKMSSLDYPVKKNSCVTSSKDLVDAGAVSDGMMKMKEKMDEEVTSRSSVGVDIATLEHAEIRLNEDQNDSDGDEEEDDVDGYDDEETIRLAVPIKKPETQDNIQNTSSRQKEITNQLSFFNDPKTNVNSNNIIYQSRQIEVKDEEKSNLSIVEETTEVSISLDLIGKLEVLKLE